MDSGGRSPAPFRRRKSTKSSLSGMPPSHRHGSPQSPPPYLLPQHSPLTQDPHYNNEHSVRYRRIHYPGDGLDFRRLPVRAVMSTSAAGERSDLVARRNEAPVIDLTEEDDLEDSQGTRSEAASSNAATAGSSRAQRLPRFGRAVIDVESSDAEGDPEPSHFPDVNYLALPNGRSRPQYSGLRRPAHPPSPPREMDEVEFVSERPRARPQNTSRQPSPNFRYRSATPYPRETIDLTDDIDDDIVHLNTRQREAANADPSDAAARAGAQDNPAPDQGYMPRIVELLRDEGVALGGRLMQRLQDHLPPGFAGFAGLNGELRAQQQAFEQFNHNHNLNHNHDFINNDNNRNNHRTHTNRHRNPHGPFRPGYMAGARPVNLPGMMNYDATGFDMGMGGNRPPTPKYEPPPDPPEGFTRSPAEDEVVVCPNCGDELATGEGDIKQEVWVIKGCGHAYCGLCAQNRSRAVNKKGKGKGKAPVTDDGNLPPPFKKCVVEGCNKPAVKNSMIHVFLGS